MWPTLDHPINSPVRCLDFEEHQSIEIDKPSPTYTEQE